MKKIIAISGSTRKYSTQLNYINAIAELAKNIFTINIFGGLSEIPHFNPDIDDENPPQQVVEFRRQLSEADGVLICTPEYAMGVPGTLKNAIDWTVSSCEFNHKPTVLITASSLGQKGHISLMETLKIIEAKITDETQLVISFAKIKVSKDYKITDETTLNEVKKVIKAFDTILSNSRTPFQQP
ncbi:MAG: NADPH-dependent FMN reductase [Bacteriovoracaceae bacterium]|nr:NAD(P)H-dependent oxidoreductase [Bacteroidota bacterium]